MMGATGWLVQTCFFTAGQADSGTHQIVFDGPLEPYVDVVFFRTRCNFAVASSGKHSIDFVICAVLRHDEDFASS
jgi:hypothetical protein